MTWDEANLIFGKAIANNYLVFQVTARNLSGEQEFLLHNVQVAVSAIQRNGKGFTIGDPSHFRDGRDKVFSRGVALVGQGNSTRNVAERVMEALGAVLGSASLVSGGPAFRDALQVFTTAAIPGFKALFPDYTIQQLNRLNDFAFSAANAYRIVIPKNGSVPFVTFLPSKIFASGYKDWTPEELFALSQKSFVVLAGKHIVEADSSKVEVSKLDCPTAGGFLDLTKAAGDDLTCTIAGQNLHRLGAILFKNSTESNDKQTASAKVTVSGQSTSGTAVFSLKQLKTLTAPEYTVYIPDATAGDFATTISYKLPPVLTGITLTGKLAIGGVPCNSTTPCTFSVQGNNLALASSFVLKKSDSDTTAAAKATKGATATDGSIPLTFAFADLQSLGVTTDTVYRLQAITADGFAVLPTLPVTLGPPSPQIARIECPSSGSFLDLSKAVNDDFTCAVTGTILDRLSGVRLINSANTSDAAVANAKLAAGGTATAVNVIFSLKSLKELKAAEYALNTVDPNNAVVATKLTLKLPPVVASVSNDGQLKLGTAPCNATGACSLTVTGTNLGLVKQFVLKKANDTTALATGTVGSLGADGTLPVTFQSADLKKLDKGDYRLQAVTSDGTAILPTAAIAFDK